MSAWAGQDVLVTFLGLGLVMILARTFGNAATRLRQPRITGELVAGVILGPTVMGALIPSVARWLFPSTGPARLTLDTLATFAFAAWLLVAGMEVDLSTMLRRRWAAALVALAGIIGPATIGFALGCCAPQLLGASADEARLSFAFFIAAGLSISAVPVISRTLMDLSLYRTDVGMITMGAAMTDDLVGWIAFALIVGMTSGGTGHGGPALAMLWKTAAFVVLALTVFRRSLHGILSWLERGSTEPAGVMGFGFGAVLMGGALGEWIGIGIAPGCFLVGIAIGDSRCFPASVRSTIRLFVTFVLAPVFFASVGLRVDFASSFRWLAVLTVVLVGTAGKTLGCTLGARAAGMRWRHAWAVGFAMNSRGGMEIIFGLAGLQQGFIGEPTFVALVVLALSTSMLAGPVVGRLAREVRGSEASRAVPSPGALGDVVEEPPNVAV